MQRRCRNLMQGRMPATLCEKKRLHPLPLPSLHLLLSIIYAYLLISPTTQGLNEPWLPACLPGEGEKKKRRGEENSSTGIRAPSSLQLNVPR